LFYEDVDKRAFACVHLTGDGDPANMAFHFIDEIPQALSGFRIDKRGKFCSGLYDLALGVCKLRPNSELLGSGLSGDLCLTPVRLFRNTVWTENFAHKRTQRSAPGDRLSHCE
jgi:hypothetical protein